MRLVHWTSKIEAHQILREGFLPRQQEHALPVWERAFCSQHALGIPDGISFGIPGMDSHWRKMVGMYKKVAPFGLSFLSSPAPLAGIEIDIDLSKARVVRSQPRVTVTDFLGKVVVTTFPYSVEIVVPREEVNRLLHGARLITESIPIPEKERWAIKKMALKGWAALEWSALKGGWKLRKFLTMKVRAEQVKEFTQLVLSSRETPSEKAVKRCFLPFAWILRREMKGWKELASGLDSVSLAKYEECMEGFDTFLDLLSKRA